jgi:sugar phosphate isomerase/epimerase
LHRLPERSDPNRGDFAGALVVLGRAADRYSMVVALSASTSNSAMLHESISEAGCPWFGVDLDAATADRDTFATIGTLIRHVRARDAIVTDRNIRLVPIGQGAVDWPRLLGALEQADYRGAITIDPAGLPDPASGAIQGKAWLEKH